MLFHLIKFCTISGSSNNVHQFPFVLVFNFNFGIIFWNSGVNCINGSTNCHLIYESHVLIVMKTLNCALCSVSRPGVVCVNQSYYLRYLAKELRLENKVHGTL